MERGADMSALPQVISEYRDAGALFAVNHSAGKDSQAMLIQLRRMGVPDSQIVIVHADLGEVEWPGNLEHIRQTIGNVPFIVARAKKTFLEMVEHRQMFPSPGQRQCTSDLKRGPIQRELRRYLKKHPEFGGRIVNCMGMRAQESAARAKRPSIIKNRSCSIAGRDWIDWLPIHEMTHFDVFATIFSAGQRPHWAYYAGMSRLSCVFCIMASASDLKVAANLNRELYRRYVATEKRIGHTLSMSGKGLEQITGVPA
tara:strand:+ start:4338 stop:5105 length:768 start_codon:yes stop_codon:yes gene_type:complete